MLLLPYQDVMRPLLPGVAQSLLLEPHEVLVAFVAPVLGAELVGVGAERGGRKAGVNGDAQTRCRLRVPAG